MKVKLVTFDVTNTVIRVLGSVGQQYAAVGEQYGISADPRKLNEAFRVQWKEQNLVHPNYGVTTGLSSYKWWTELVRKTFVQAGFEGKMEGLDVISGHLYRHFTSPLGWEVLPNSHNVLQELKNRGILLGVVSNFDSRLERILMNLELLHYFNFILTSEKMKVAKPDKEIFLEALKCASVSSCEALHVGDNVENDYFSAKQAGMTGVLLLKDTDNIPKDVDKKHCIKDLSELLNVF